MLPSQNNETWSGLFHEDEMRIPSILVHRITHPMASLLAQPAVIP